MNLEDYVSDHPIPGESLTADPNQKLPFEMPPEHADMQEATDYIWERLTREESISQLFTLLRKDVPLSDSAQVITYTGFAEGKWNYDLVLSLLEPTIYMIMYLAYKAKISFVYSREIPSLEGMLEQKKHPPILKEMDANTPKGLMSKEKMNG